jgi:hypothetical protein
MMSGSRAVEEDAFEANGLVSHGRPVYVVRMSMLTSLRHHLGLMRAFGLPAAVSIGFRRRFRLRKAVKVRWGRDKLIVRPHESDPNVASAVLGRTEYALGAAAEGALARLATRWRAKGATPIIIDGGANVGYAAVYFARTFPEATVIAIEPNAETFRVLQKNCAGHANIKTVFGALWSHGDGVSLRSTPERSWADNVQEFAHSPPGSDLTPSYKLQDLLRLVPGQCPSSSSSTSRGRKAKSAVLPASC